VDEKERDKRKARARAIWAAGFLLAGVAAFLGAATTDGNPLLALGAVALVIASALTAVGAVAAGSRAMADWDKRRVLLWSSWCLALALAGLVISGGVGAILAGPTCQRVAEEGCGFTYGLPLIGIWAFLGVASVITYLGAGIAGVSNAAQSGERGWFAAILASLLGSAAVVVAAIVALVQGLIRDPTLQVAVLVLVPLSLLLFSVLTLIYGLSGVKQSKRP
jgi:hypothetical protein